MTYPVRTQGQALEALRTRRPSRAEQALVLRTERESHQGIVGGARVQAAAYVTHVGLQSLALLCDEANFHAEHSRGLDAVDKARYQERSQRVVDAFAGVVAAEIASMGWQ